MTRIKLGLDIGTNSIGWAILEKEDKKYHFFEKKNDSGDIIPIPTRGSYIFPKGTEANEKSKAATRRGFRGARRRIDRIRLRKIATLKVLARHDLSPNFTEGELNRWKNKKVYPCDNQKFIDWQRTGKKGGDIESEKRKQPYYLRFLAATQGGLMDSQKGRHQLGRAFYHLAQRRGYKSNGDDEQTDDKLEQFKVAILKLIEEHSSCASFYEPFKVFLGTYKSEKKVDSLGKKIIKTLKKEVSFENLTEFIKNEFNKKENLGKVEGGIQELSEKIEESGMPTMGSYFYSIYAKTNEDGIIGRIRGRYTDREKHYLREFNYICDKQDITGELRNQLHDAIFYQRPLKSQKGLVAKCPFETKRKRIAISHPLFEEFRMWESINRIKIKTATDYKLRPLEAFEKKLIIRDFQQKTDFDFEKLAKKLSQEKDYRYIKDKNKLAAEVEFNFPMDKTFSACPTMAQLKKNLGKEDYSSRPLLNSGYKNEKGKYKVSIEDIWHCLFADSFGNKDKTLARKDFAKKHLPPDVDAEAFSKIKLKKGYGSLSKAAIKKILPFLREGYLYSHAVFLANISSVIGRTPLTEERKQIEEAIKKAIDEHKTEKSVNAIVNNYLERFKDNNSSLGDNPNSVWIHMNGIKKEINVWFSEEELADMDETKQLNLEKKCWEKFSVSAKEKRPKEIEFVKSRTIFEFIERSLKEIFPNDDIKIDNLYHPSAMEAYPKTDDKLGNPEISAIKNPVFNKAMHQIKRLVNKLIEEGLVDQDTEVNIELAREINSASYRRALAQYQKDQQTIREWARKKIIGCYNESVRENIIPTGDQITKYILYSEQRGRCLYTNETITPRKFFTEQKYDIEHTIPRSVLNDNSLKNKTLANADFNRNYKKDELPANLDIVFNGNQITPDVILTNRDANLRSYTISNEEVHFDVELDSLRNDLKKYKNVAKVATGDVDAHEDLMMKVHYTQLKLDYLASKYKKFELEEVPSKFTHANLVDTRIITKYARAYLNSYFKRVNVVNGQITDTLRKIWGLQGEYEEKDRSNHIHHCIDAVTVACVEKGTVNRMSEAFHKFERDYYNGNGNAKINLPEPMEDFVSTIKKLQEEIFIYHKQQDRIKPLLEELGNEKPKKLNLRGPLNSQNPYGLIQKNDQKIYVQRTPVSKISGKDIDNIVDEAIKKRLLDLADHKGWQLAIDIDLKEGEDEAAAIQKKKKELAVKIFSSLKKAKANRALIDLGVTMENMTSDFSDVQSLKAKLSETTMQNGLPREKILKYRSKVSVEVDKIIRTTGLNKLLKDSNGVIILPASLNAKQMVLKKIRLKIRNNNLYPLKERRKMDFSQKRNQEYKRDFYFDKEAGSNYEAIIYGNLLPNENGKLKREYRLINHFNIVKNVSMKEPSLPPLFKIHSGDLFLVFDKHIEEINWEDHRDIQNRLFRNVKFDENGILVFARNNYAGGDVDHAAPAKEDNLLDLNGKVLRRSPSTCRAIPTKVDELGRIDIEYSKAFIEKHSKSTSTPLEISTE
jgi:CRISPR-associated endonuclease Csn1